MAEPIGLAMSGIALAGLFSTCIEFVEYFEQGKNWAKDFQLALTKVSLMKRRLSQWGTAMSVSSPGAEAQSLRARWPSESGVIMESLMGIRDILASTTYMCRRYRFSKGEMDPAHWPQWKIDGDAKEVPLEGNASVRSTQSNRQNTFRTARLKAIWAVQDRKKFQTLIGDLDFLLSNLETIGERLLKESTMADRIKQLPDTDGNLTDYSTTDPTTEDTNQQLILTCEDSQLAIMSKTSSANSSSDNDIVIPASETSIPEHYNFVTRKDDQHGFWRNTSEGYADMHLGDYYKDGIVPPSAKRHNYVSNGAKGDSTLRAGNTDGETAAKLAREKQAARLEREREARGAAEGRSST